MQSLPPAALSWNSSRCVPAELGLANIRCTFSLLLILLIATFAAGENKPPQQSSAPVCIKCHRAETLRYRSTAMGRSFGLPEPTANATVKHQHSGSTLTVTTANGTMFHTLNEHGFTAKYAVPYQVGGGMQGATFLVRLGDYLFESPLSWFNAYGWDVSPGYEMKNVLEFDRGVASECIYCHATGARFDDPDGRHLISKYLQPITCERCHGPSEQHVQHPTKANILNPAKLSGPVRDSICEQCHLEGVVRILNPGKDWTDYQPGKVTEDSFTKYVLLGYDKPEVPLASEVEQFAQSRCVQATKGKFWCSACHNPHREARPRQEEIRAVCTSCHQKLSPAAHPASVKECTSCHMPSTTKVTISHASHTDHRILRNPATYKEPPREPKLVAWREPPEAARQRNLGLAELQLSPTDYVGPWHDGAKQLLSLPTEQLKNDPEVAAALEDYFFRTSNIDKAVEWGQRSVDLNPRSADAALNFARVLQASGAATQADVQYHRAIKLDPSLKEAYGRLAMSYAKEHDTDDATKVLDQYLKWNPDEIFFHEMKQRLTPAAGGKTQ